MLCKRIIARLDVKGPNLVKGVHLEGLRIIGDPQEYAYKYMQQGADELFYVDTVASLYGRNNLVEIVRNTAKKVFIPLTVEGGIRSVEDMRELLCAGADKIAINTAAVKNPELITEGAKHFGSQAIVCSIAAKEKPDGTWENYMENGREKTGLDVIEWIKKAIELGAGEIMLTSIDQEGTMKGMNWRLIDEASKVCTVPLIVCGGPGSMEDVTKVMKNKGVDALAVASLLHYDKFTIKDMKKSISKTGVNVRL